MFQPSANRKHSHKNMNPESPSSTTTRRSFLKTSATALTGAAVASTLAPRSRAADAKPKPIQIALIGCGGRGTGAARDCLAAAQWLNLDVKLTMMADLFKDRMDRSRGALKDLGVDVPESRCLFGFDAYKKVMESDVDLVLLTTPPNFRSVHFPAAVAAGKHAFVEKPVAVDPAGYHAIVEAGKIAAQKNLSVVAGTQRRHEVGYNAVAKLIKDGAIGEIVGGTIHFCLGGGSIPAYTGKEPEWEFLIRHWGGWAELSGDHIVEQHVHSIDVMNWYLGTHPINCVSFGHRAQRKGGNNYDFFSTDYEFPNNVHIHSMARQVNGCWSRIGQSFRGEKGIAEVTGLVAADRVYVGSADKKNKLTLPTIEGHKNSYTNEHADLLRSIVEQKPINEAQQIAESSLTAVMGRISAYTGQMITWEEMVGSCFTCKPSPKDFAEGTVVMPKAEPTLPPGKFA